MMKRWMTLLMVPVLMWMSCSKPSAPDGESIYAVFAPDNIPFVVSDSAWLPDSLGNHRAVVRAQANGMIKAVLPWRRADARPQSKDIIVTDAACGEKIQRVGIVSLNAESGVVVWDGAQKDHLYYIYYMPYKFPKGDGDARYYRHNDYLKPDSGKLIWGRQLKTVDLPQAEVLRFESRNTHNCLTMMGVAATSREMDSLATCEKGKGMVLFAEDRAYPIRLTDVLPVRWIQTGVRKILQGVARRNEYYTYQIGVWAPYGGLKNLKIQFSGLKCGSEEIPASAITCFNTEGINAEGVPVCFTVDVPQGKVQALWCGVDVPTDVKPGDYTGTATVWADDLPEQQISVRLCVTDPPLEDRGDGDLWRHARLRWLNSVIGIDNKPVTPYEPMTVKDRTVSATGKTVTLGANGLPVQIEINGRQVLSAPMMFVVNRQGKEVKLTTGTFNVLKDDDGRISWEGTGGGGGIKYHAAAVMEFDGYACYTVSLCSGDGQRIPVEDVKLVIPFSSYASAYFMGVGFSGGARPELWNWQWEGPYDSFWMGNEWAGLHVELRGGSYHGPLLNDYKPAPPASWCNENRGGVCVKGAEQGNAQVYAYTRTCELNGEPLTFQFGVLITPVKPVDLKKQFSQRYYHMEPRDARQGISQGANIVNIHHATSLNPVINYPWVVREPLKQFIDSMHAGQVKVKLYYTVRELTTFATEIYALKSLNHEILVSGEGYGPAWAAEHLIDDYRPAWYSELKDGDESDVAVVVNGFSRWINYYLEGLRWMLQNYKIDGIYMDDVAFDRNVIKRMRKIMEKERPGALIDLHSNTAYSCGPMNQYADFMPYIDRTWFGESFRYNQMTPDEWFVTFSAIPMGLMSEMLQDGGNPYLGMIYGTTRRFWTDERSSPVPMWNLWREFGIGDARMIGYWTEHPAVWTAHPMVKATAYVKEGKTLLVVGNFDDKPHPVNLKIDWNCLALQPSKVRVSMPGLGYMQPSRENIDIGSTITVGSKKALFFLLEQ